MSSVTSPLMHDFLAWVSTPRTYGETMDAWRSTCPRLSIWEDALAAGYIRLEFVHTMKASRVVLTSTGAAMLKSRRGNTGEGA